MRQTEAWGQPGRKMRIPGSSGCMNSAKVCEQLGQGEMEEKSRNIWQQTSLSLGKDCCKGGKAAFFSYVVPEESSKCIAMSVVLVAEVAHPACAGCLFF